MPRARRGIVVLLHIAYTAHTRFARNSLHFSTCAVWCVFSSAVSRTGNNSQFSYDPLGRCVKIVETTSGTVTSTKQFLWCGAGRCEVRDSLGNLTNQYFGLGQTNIVGGVATKLFYTTDHPGSVREVTDSTGLVVEAQYSYDPYGIETNVQTELVPSDFQYGGMYLHQRSGKYLTLFRAYDSGSGRWLSKDPFPYGGLNPYRYVHNNPIGLTDPLGLCDGTGGGTIPGTPSGTSPAPGWRPSNIVNTPGFPMNMYDYTNAPTDVGVISDHASRGGLLENTSDQQVLNTMQRYSLTYLNACDSGLPGGGQNSPSAAEYYANLGNGFVMGSLGDVPTLPGPSLGTVLYGPSVGIGGPGPAQPYAIYPPMTPANWSDALNLSRLFQ